MRVPTWLFLSLLSCSALAAPWQPSAPGAASAEAGGGTIRLRNRALSLTWRLDGAPGVEIENRWDRSRLSSPAEPFAVVTRSGETRAASQFHVVSAPKVETIPPAPRALRAAERRGGRAVSETLLDERTGLRATWRAVLRDGADYVRTELTLVPTKGDVDLSEVDLVDLRAPGAAVSGEVSGSPVVAGDVFFGLEHPMSVSKVEDGRARCLMTRKLPLRAGQATTYSAVFGVAPAGQLRRAFLDYVESERARPYQPFLHYNSWYDIGYFTRYDEAQCLDRIHAVGKALAKKRGVKLSSYLFDDGWDDTSTVWEFNKGFPHGFAPLKAAAAEYGAAPGIWLSPWGGYGKPHDQRIETGKRLGYEMNDEGYALSGPKYYARFHEVCMDLVGKYGINQFKLDGTGDPDKQYPGSAFPSDFDAAIQLIEDLRKAQPSLFVNLTTGTWPSPFWTRYADSIWRGGYDHSFAGVGSWRQRWITYKDGDTYQGIVRQGPLYPLNSLMLHGLIYAEHARNLNTDPGNDFRDEIHAYFATGTQLQEMYITPSLLSERNWDDLAEAAKWARANADVLRDVHWVGGDPLKLEVYGHAAWNGSKAILELRNPSDKPQDFAVDPRAVFELPARDGVAMALRPAFASDAAASPIELLPGRATNIHLRPFQVLVLERV